MLYSSAELVEASFKNYHKNLWSVTGGFFV
jgi:hypothetical protein